MCPSNLFSLFMLAVIALVAVTLRNRVRDITVQNFSLLGRILTSTDQQFGWTQGVMNGFYKGRKVTMVATFINKGETRTIFIQPQVIPQPQKRFLFNYPRPTPNTQWKGTRVHYNPPGLAKESYYKTYTEEEFRGILEELNTAAHKIESNQI